MTNNDGQPVIATKSAEWPPKKKWTQPNKVKHKQLMNVICVSSNLGLLPLSQMAIWGEIIFVLFRRLVPLVLAVKKKKPTV